MEVVILGVGVLVELIEGVGVGVKYIVTLISQDGAGVCVGVGVIVGVIEGVTVGVGVVEVVTVGVGVVEVVTEGVGVGVKYIVTLMSQEGAGVCDGVEV